MAKGEPTLSHPPSSLFGRDLELQRLAETLQQADEAHVPVVCRIIGRSGFGKTALLKKVTAAAADRCWVVLQATCYRGQARTAVAALRRLAHYALRDFDGERERYRSGLERELGSPDVPVARFAEAFTQFIEGVLLDHPCLLAIDDAQWLDPESFTILHRLLSDASTSTLAVLTTQRVEEVDPFAAIEDALTLNLRPLRNHAARAVVRELYPCAPDVVVDGIVERAGGIPFDIAALARQAAVDGATTIEDVLNSAHVVVRDGIAALAPASREFLQLCSLIGEPIELRLLVKLIGDAAKLEELIRRSSGRYLIADGGGLRFSHELVAETVRSTIVLRLPLQRRILATLLSLGEAQLKDYDRIAALADELGERETEYDYLVRLARTAYAEQAYDTAIHAFQRALAIKQPPLEGYASFFNEYGIALRLADRYADAQVLLERAFSDGIARGVRNGLGLLASALVWVVRSQSDTESARALYRQLLDSLDAPDERGDLLAMGAMLATEADDLEEFERIKTQLWSLGQPPSRYALALSEVAEALIMSRIGRFTEAWRAIRNARIHVDTQRSAHKFSVELYSLTIRLRESGCAIARYELPALLRRERVEAPKSVELSALALGACVDFAAGDWGDALAKLDASDLASINHTLTRTRMQSIPAAIAALTGHAPARADLLENDVATALRGALWARAAPLALWWAAFIALTRPRDAARLIQPLRAHLADPLGAEIFHFPMAAALYATRADRALLAELSDPPREERAPWHRAQQALAAGLARHALGRADGAPLLREARGLAYDLGARFLAAYAADHLSEATPAEAALLRTLGVDRTGAAARPAVGSTGKPHRAALAVPTVREIQVAELVEEGYSNRQVAEALVLSERTIEAHITNLFNKLHISSRTQLARWIVERRAGTMGRS